MLRQAQHERQVKAQHERQQKAKSTASYPPAHPEPVEGLAGVACFGRPGVDDGGWWLLGILSSINFYPARPEPVEGGARGS